MELKYDNGILKIPIRLLENLRLKFESTGTVNIDRYKDFIIIRDKLNTKHNFFETLESMLNISLHCFYRIYWKNMILMIV